MTSTNLIAGICIIGTRRTGSNHLMNVLENVGGLESTGEMFSQDRVIGIERILPQLRRTTGLAIQRTDDRQLVDLARRTPGAFLAAFEEAVRLKRKRAYCFKVFEHQLGREALESEVLSRPGMRSVLLVRRSVDAYISLLKAVRTDQWMTVDTTAIQVAPDAEAFAAWLEEQRRWYAHWLAYARMRGETPVILTYDDHIAQPTRIVLSRFVTTARELGVSLRQPLWVRNRGLNRQDRNAQPAERVANWEEFLAGLDRLKLREAAFGYPL